MATMEVKQEFQDDNDTERNLQGGQQHYQGQQEDVESNTETKSIKEDEEHEIEDEIGGQSDCNNQEHDSSLDNKNLTVAIKADQETQDDDEEGEDNSETNIPDEGKTNLIVNYLPQQMTDEEFSNLFKKFGPMKSCKIVRNRSSGSSYGFGFVDYETHEQSMKAIEELNGYELDTKRIKVAFARPTGQGIKQANLYVKNVPNGWAEDNIRQVFEPYGKIIQVRVLGNDRGIAFVLYDLRKQAEDALEALNGHKPDGGDKEFEVRFANEQKEKKLKVEPKMQSNKDNDNTTSNSSSRRRNRNRSRDHGRNNNNNIHQGDSNSNNNHNNDNQLGGRGKRQNQQQRKGNFNRNNNSNNNNNNNNFSHQNNQRQQKDMGNNNLNGFGPVRQQSSSRMNRFAPFAPVAQPPPISMNPMIMAQPIAQMLPNQVYAAFPGQQPQMIPYGQMMTAPQTQMAPMQAMTPQFSGQNQITMYGNPTIPQAAPLMNAPLTGYNMAQQQNMFNVASNTMANAANLQPHMTRNTSNSGGGSGGGGHMGSGHNHGGGGGHGGADSGEGVTLFVYNIGPDSDEGALRSMFSSYGQVVKCNVVRKSPGGTTKGFGFVTMKTRAQANAAIAGLDGSQNNGRSLQVSLKK